MSTIQSNLHDAKTQLSRLVTKALQGDQVIIAKAGKPLVQLVPLTPPAKRSPGVLKGKFNVPETFFEPLSEQELSDWE